MGELYTRLDRSAFLFGVPTFLDGLAQTFNVAGTDHSVYSTSATADEADRRALRQDWAAYGDDLRRASSPWRDRLPEQ